MIEAIRGMRRALEHLANCSNMPPCPGCHSATWKALADFRDATPLRDDARLELDREYSAFYTVSLIDAELRRDE